MKKFLSFVLVAVMLVCTVALASCNSNPADTTGGDNTQAPGTADAATTDNSGDVITVPDVTLTYVDSKVYADADHYQALSYTKAEPNLIAVLYMDSVDFNDDFSIKQPDEMSLISEFVLRIPEGKKAEEINVFKVADAANLDTVKSLAEYRYNKIKNNGDLTLYDDEEGSNAAILETGKIAVAGNFVIFTLTKNSEVSMLRARKFISENPDCTADQVYKAIVSEIAG